MTRKSITPSSDFTNKVMTGVKRRPRKIGAWNLVYFAPVVFVFALLLSPMTQNSLTHLSNPKYTAVSKVQSDVDEIQQITVELSQFELNEAQLLADQASLLDETNSDVQYVEQ